VPPQAHRKKVDAQRMPHVDGQAKVDPLCALYSNGKKIKGKVTGMANKAVQTAMILCRNRPLQGD
jgi:hypothetical protein